MPKGERGKRRRRAGKGSPTTSGDITVGCDYCGETGIITEQGC